MRAHKSACPLAGGHDADNQNSNHLDSATGERQRKEESTLIARLALAGHAVHQGRGGDFLVSKYGLSYYAQDFDALQAFALKLGMLHHA